MGSATMRALQYDPKKSVNAARNVLFQNTFLTEVVKRLEEDPTSVIAELEEYRSSCKLFVDGFKNRILKKNSSVCTQESSNSYHW